MSTAEIIKLEERLYGMLINKPYIFMDADILSLFRYIKYMVFDSNKENFKSFLGNVLKDNNSIDRFLKISKMIFDSGYTKPIKNN